jgi:hypothetical protein
MSTEENVQIVKKWFEAIGRVDRLIGEKRS